MNKYKWLCELQSECDLLSLDQSIHLTELIKLGDSIDVATFLLTIMIKGEES